MMKVTAIFDIGKTNKKCFLFDEQFNEVHKDYVCFDEIKDEDGDPCDDLTAIVHWIRQTVDRIMLSDKYELEAINFSTYGASLVHSDKNGQPLTPLYNYLKPYPNYVLANFHSKYGDSMTIAQETSSPALKMLNSGLQLYWLKYQKPEIFNKIHCSLHFPQYLSFVFTGEAYSEYTGLGCHTMLWNFSKNNYHRWVYAEGIDRLLAPIVSTDQQVEMQYKGKNIRVGMGIHDSSAALLPYMRINEEPFLLLSTGTWSIALNPFTDQSMTRINLEQDCLNFMRIDGKPVRVARLFLGNEYNIQIKKLTEYFSVHAGDHKKVVFNAELCDSLRADNIRKYHFVSLQRDGDAPLETNFNGFNSFEEAYHQLMIELVEVQAASVKLAIGNTDIKKLYVDGGFADNEVFIELLAREFKGISLTTTCSPLGSALGAAMVVSSSGLHRSYFQKHFKEARYTEPDERYERLH